MSGMELCPKSNSDSSDQLETPLGTLSWRHTDVGQWVWEQKRGPPHVEKTGPGLCCREPRGNLLARLVPSTVCSLIGGF